MSPFNARSNNQGFTLIETLTVVIIIGILSAIAAPSLLGMLNKNKVSSALDQVQGALQEAQREAMRKGKQCKVFLISTNSIVTDTDPNSPYTDYDCLVTGDRILSSGVALGTNLSPATITFSFRGNTNNSGTIVLYKSDDSNQQKKCLVISSGLGIMRTGNYSGSTSSATDITNGTCTTS